MLLPPSGTHSSTGNHFAAWLPTAAEMTSYSSRLLCTVANSQREWQAFASSNHVPAGNEHNRQTETNHRRKHSMYQIVKGLCLLRVETDYSTSIFVRRFWSNNWSIRCEVFGVIVWLETTTAGWSFNFSLLQIFNKRVLHVLTPKLVPKVLRWKTPPI